MAMSARAQRAIAPKRPTDQKASVFPVTVCERNVPQNARAVRVASRTLALPPPEPRRILVLADTGCRLSSWGTGTWQACNDPIAWPFGAIATVAARTAPDVVVHVGDYHYRESACPSADAACAGSPWGYGWDTWRADFFFPAAPLLAAAPWIFVRGNHEECARAGQGWFRFLDPYPFTAKRSCDDPANDGDANYSPTYAVPLGHATQVIVFDSSKAGYTPLLDNDPQFRAYRDEFVEATRLATRTAAVSFFAAHHPLLGFVPQKDAAPLPGTASLLSVARTLFADQYFPSGVKLTLHGHMHDFQAIGFATGQAPTVVAGIGGDFLDVELPAPFPATLSPAPGVVVDAIAHAARFGFVLLEQEPTATWTITAYAADGRVIARCAVDSPRLRCEPDLLDRRR